jgi:DNA-3-methyladenine glycosylase
LRQRPAARLSIRPLPRSFYLRPTRTVARALLGAVVIRTLGRTTLLGRIVETEAYLGARDPASHAFRGRTPRNEVMFWKGGHLYVYFTYGMHYCANVVTEDAGAGRAVLIRAVEPLRGLPAMRRRRRGRHDLASGPAKFCEAFGIGRDENGTDLCGGAIVLARGEPVLASRIVATTRIGIRSAREKRWRYYIRGSPFISRP